MIRLLAVALILAGIGVYVLNPSWGLVVSFLCVVAGLILGIMAVLGQGNRVTADSGPTRACPNCRRRFPPQMTVCPHCGHRYGTDR